MTRRRSSCTSNTPTPRATKTTRRASIASSTFLATRSTTWPSPKSAPTKQSMSDTEPTPRGPAAMPLRLLLLRHGEVASHRGDVPVTERGLTAAAEFGRALGEERARHLLVLSAETRRTRETACVIADGARAAGTLVEGPSVAFALRNPDLYLGGVRVDMVSTAAAFAAQVPGMTEALVAAGRVLEPQYPVGVRASSR